MTEKLAMKYLVTGSAGHLGEALMRSLRARGADAVGLDIKASAFTDVVGSIVDPNVVGAAVKGVDAVLHAATLHKPHVATHARRDFIDVNVTGTLNLLEAAVRERVGAFVFTSTTSAFGDALTPPPEAPAAWITEDVTPRSKNIYGVTKLAAEDLCWLAHRRDALACIILRTSRFFPEAQDDAGLRAAYSTENSQALEFLHRRVDLEDVVSAHLCAVEKASSIGFDRLVISATTPFRPDHRAVLRRNAGDVVRGLFDYEGVFARFGWRMYPSVDRVYVNARARKVLGWRPRHDFGSVLRRLAEGGRVLSDLAYEVGSKGYHDEVFEDGPFPVE